MLNISKQICVGWNTSAVDELHEVEVIPVGSSPQEKARMKKLLTRYKETGTHDNVPLPGFTLCDVNRKGWGSSEPTWVIIDPRGFLVRITQDNMIDILRVTGVTEGLIQQRCIWARENSASKLSLVPMTSDNYSKAVSNTELLDAKVKMADVNIGDKVFLQNGLVGNYMGVMSLHCSVQASTYGGDFKVQSMIRRQVVEITPGKFYYHTDAKILRVENKVATPITKEDAIIYVNSCITDPSTYFTATDRISGQYYGSSGKVQFVSSCAKVTMDLESIDQTEAAKILAACRTNSDQGKLILEDANGVRFIVDFPWLGTTAVSLAADSFHTVKIKSMTEDAITLEHSKNSYYGYGSVTKPKFILDNFVKFYKIVKHVKNDTYV